MLLTDAFIDHTKYIDSLISLEIYNSRD